jgi:hypothetical protein
VGATIGASVISPSGIREQLAGHAYPGARNSGKRPISRALRRCLNAFVNTRLVKTKPRRKRDESLSKPEPAPDALSKIQSHLREMPPTVCLPLSLRRIIE